MKANEVEKTRKSLVKITDLNNGLGDVPAVEDTMKKVGKIDEWVSSGINWQDALLDYSERALTADDTIVDSLTAREKGPTQLTVKVRIKDYQTEGDLVKELQKQPGFITTERGSKQLFGDDELFDWIDSRDSIRAGPRAVVGRNQPTSPGIFV